MDSTYSVVGLAVLLMATPLAGSCATDCPAEPCQYTFQINFAEQGNWEPGTWDFVLEESGTRVGSCTIELPEPESSSSTSCSGQLELNETSDGNGVASVETFHDFTEGETNVDDSFSRTITLSVRRDGEQFTGSTLEPTFERKYLNGPDCPPACWQATVQYAF